MTTTNTDLLGRALAALQEYASRGSSNAHDVGDALTTIRGELSRIENLRLLAARLQEAAERSDMIRGETIDSGAVRKEPAEIAERVLQASDDHFAKQMDAVVDEIKAHELAAYRRGLKRMAGWLGGLAQRRVMVASQIEDIEAAIDRGEWD